VFSTASIWGYNIQDTYCTLIDKNLYDLVYYIKYVSMNKRPTLFEKIVICFSLLLLLVQEVKAQVLTTKQQDSAYLVNPTQERIRKIKKSFAKTFVDFVGNDVSLFGSLVLSKQNINDNGVTAPINYLYNTVNSNTFNTGYSGGFRIDGIYKEKHRYSLSFAVNRITPGNNYQNKHSLSPFIDDFTHFKADNNFTTLSIAAHYKKLLPVNAMNKYKFYAVFGPSLDYKISRISSENLVNGAGNRAIINGDFGVEFDNKGYYVLFAHYKLGVNMTSSSCTCAIKSF
jgi:hypothetical protein